MSTYNGWTNYATWRVNLEVFNGGNWAGSTPDSMKEFVEEILSAECVKGQALDYAMAFIDEVNWHEIAAHYQGEKVE